MSWSAVPSAVDGDPITEARWDQLMRLINEEAMVKFDDQVLGSDTASVTFSNIPQTHRNLLIWCANTRVSTAITATGLIMRFNGDSAGNYDNQTFGGTNGAAGGQTVEAFAQTAHSFGMLTCGTSASDAANCGFSMIEILEYSSTSKHKVLTDLCGVSNSNVGAGQYVRSCTGRWRSTAAITSITIACANNLVTGSRFTLWGSN